jgi:hypothetical protein
MSWSTPHPGPVDARTCRPQPARGILVADQRRDPPNPVPKARAQPGLLLRCGCGQQLGHAPFTSLAEAGQVLRRTSTDTCASWNPWETNYPHQGPMKDTATWPNCSTAVIPAYFSTLTTGAVEGPMDVRPILSHELVVGDDLGVLSSMHHRSPSVGWRSWSTSTPTSARPWASRSGRPKRARRPSRRRSPSAARRRGRPASARLCPLEQSIGRVQHRWSVRAKPDSRLRVSRAPMLLASSAGRSAWLPAFLGCRRLADRSAGRVGVRPGCQRPTGRCNRRDSGQVRPRRVPPCRLASGEQE